MTMEEDYIVETNNVKKDYYLGTTVVNALRGVMLNIVKGGFACIVGPSGSGKTTLLNLIGCIDHPTSGEVIISSVNVANLSDNELTRFRAERIGFIFQTFSLIPVLSAYENVEYPLLLKGYGKREIKDKVEAMLENVGLIEYRGRRPNELSGGQMQKIAIARALATEPELVLADEPTANLDTGTGEEILDVMHEMNQRFHTTFIFSTNDSLIMQHAEEIYMLRDGLIDDKSEIT